MSDAPSWQQAMRKDASNRRQEACEPPTWKEWRKQNARWVWIGWLEWPSEKIAYWSRSWDFVKVIELAGKLAVLVVAVSWFFEADEREKATAGRDQGQTLSSMGIDLHGSRITRRRRTEGALRDLVDETCLSGWSALVQSGLE